MNQSTNFSIVTHFPTTDQYFKPPNYRSANTSTPNRRTSPKINLKTHDQPAIPKSPQPSNHARSRQQSLAYIKKGFVTAKRKQIWGRFGGQAATIPWLISDETKANSWRDLKRTHNVSTGRNYRRPRGSFV